MPMHERKMIAAPLAAMALLAAAGCANPPGSASEREWARAECRQIIDEEARTKCLERVDREYGTGGR